MGAALRARLAATLALDPPDLADDVRLLADDEAAWAALAEAAGEDELEPGVRAQMRQAVQVRANRKALLADSIARLDGFLARLDEQLGDEQGGDEQGDAPRRPLNLLDDCFDDYMPSMRLT